MRVNSPWSPAKAILTESCGSGKRKTQQESPAVPGIVSPLSPTTMGVRFPALEYPRTVIRSKDVVTSSSTLFRGSITSLSEDCGSEVLIAIPLSPSTAEGSF